MAKTYKVWINGTVSVSTYFDITATNEEDAESKASTLFIDSLSVDIPKGVDELSVEVTDTSTEVHS